MQADISVSRYLRSSLSEPEDVVNEQEHILSLLVPEVLCHSETTESNTSPGTWWLVHLTIHKSHLVYMCEEGRCIH